MEEFCRLGPFTVDRFGRLSPAEPGMTPGFHVRWRGRVFHARIARGAAGDGSLSIKSNLGRVPSSATDPAARAASIAALKVARQPVAGSWRPALLADHRLQVAIDCDIALPITVTGLVTTLSASLLDLGPYLDVVDEAGLV